jgi:hypothetical protein
MKSILEFAGQQLKWVQPSIRNRVYELRAGDELVARLCWERGRGSPVSAETADGSWTFQREGLFQQRVTVGVGGAETNIAVFKPGWTGSGVLEFVDGRSFRWGPTNFWYNQWAWEYAGGGQLVQLRNDFGLLRTEGHVEVAPLAQALPELPLLSLLGWYLMLLNVQDSAAGAVVVGAVS